MACYQSMCDGALQRDCQPAADSYSAQGIEFDFVNGKKPPVPRKLRKERSMAPLFTLALLVTFIVVAYFAWKALYQG